jgi:O-antigen ligase
MDRSGTAADTAESSPGAELAASLGLIALVFLPLLGGGYSGTGYQVGLVLLPLAAAIAWGVSKHRSPLAAGVLLAFLLFGAGMPLWVNPGRLLWFYILAIPCGWVLTQLTLGQVEKRARWLLPAVTVSAVLTAVYGWYLWAGAGTVHYQIYATFGLHNAYAGYLLLAWPLAAVAAATEPKTLLKAAYYCAAGFLALTLVLTYSKASWVMFALQLLLLGGILLYQSRRGRLAGNSMRWTVAGVVAAGLALLALEPVRHALSALTDFSGYSMQGRLKFWSAALQMFADHPLGVGPGNFAYYYPQYQPDPVHYSVDPHSWPLQLLAELGIPGVIILLAILAGTVAWVRRVLGGTKMSVSGGLVVAAVVSSMAHAALDFDYTFVATTALLGTALAYGTFIAGGNAGLPEGRAQPGWVRGVAVAAVVLLLLFTVIGELYTTERYNLDRLRDLEMVQGPTSQQQSLRANLLRQCISVNKYNYRTQYQLAAMLLQPDQGDEAKAEGREHLKRALELNPRYPKAWALKGLTSRTPEEREEYLSKALDLDPWNYPEHYWHYASLTRDPAERKRRLLTGMEHIQVTEPVTPEHVRPTWYQLNPLFAQWWEELAQLEDDHELKQLYRSRAARIRVYWEGQTAQLPEGGRAT